MGFIEDEIIEAIVGNEIDRQIAIHNRWKLFDGDMVKPLKVDPNSGVDDNVILPVLRTFVLKSRAFLFGKGMTFEVGDRAQSETDEWLSRVLRRNRYQAKLLDQATNGGVAGHNFVKFNPDPDDLLDGNHRIVVLDPSNVTPCWAPGDYEDVWLWRIRMNCIMDGRLAIREQQILRNTHNDDVGTNDGWTITEYAAEVPDDQMRNGKFVPRKGQRLEFRPVKDVAPVDWPFEWAPVFHNQNLPRPNEFWGESDLEAAVVNLANSVNRTASDMKKTVRHYGSPKTVIIGAEVDEIDNATGMPLVLPEGANAFNLQMQDMSAALEYFRMLQSELHGAARVPKVSPDTVAGLGQLSGVALQLLHGPLLEMTGEKHTTYGDMQQELATRMLEYADLAMDGQDVSVSFPNPLPSDAKADAETAKLQQEAGASQTTTLEKIGLDPDTEFENLRAEAAGNTDTRGMIDRLAEGDTTDDSEGA